ncbi:hypothetical protein INR49_022850, partial [Caranx melampygus]
PFPPSPHTSANTGPHALSTNTSPLPCSRPKPRHSIYSGTIKPCRILNSWLRLSIKFKICPSRGPTSRSPNHFIRIRASYPRFRYDQLMHLI